MQILSFDEGLLLYFSFETQNTPWIDILLNAN